MPLNLDNYFSAVITSVILLTSLAAVPSLSTFSDDIVAWSTALTDIFRAFSEFCAISLIVAVISSADAAMTLTLVAASFIAEATEFMFVLISSTDEATLFNLAYQEIPGENRLLKNLLGGDWGDDFVVVPPGETVTYDMFMSTKHKNRSESGS